MTLFDGKPLSEQEVLARLMCKCGHTKGAHRGGTNCTKCECDAFTEPKPQQIAFSGVIR